MNRLYQNERLDRAPAITPQLNANCSVRLASLLALFLLCHGLHNAAAAGRERGLTKVGEFVYSDYWGPYPVREINPNDKINLLGSIMSLQSPGTNLDIRLLLSIIARGADDTPRNFTGGLDVQVRSTTNESSPRNILGSLPRTPVRLDSEPGRPGPLHATKLAAQPLDSSRSVYLYELTLHVPLQPPQTEIPEFVSIVSGMYNELDFWRWNRRKGQPPASKPSPVARDRNSAPVQQKAEHSVPPTATASVPHAAAGPTPVPTATLPLPEVRLSITREGGYLLIICSPAVTNAVLEETLLTSSPWQWRPVMTDSNAQTAGWYVPPDDGARAFRVRIPGGPGQ